METNQITNNNRNWNNLNIGIGNKMNHLKFVVIMAVLIIVSVLIVSCFVKNDDALINIIISIIGSALTIGFLYFIYTDLNLKNKIESFKQLDNFYFTRITGYGDITKKIDCIRKNKQIQFTNEDRKQIEDLLNVLEIFAIKCKELKLDIHIVDEYSGSMILNLIENSEVEEMVQSFIEKDENNFTYLTNLRNELTNLRNERRKSKT